jgi:type IX secretion system PorP/SprF family membrane protein
LHYTFRNYFASTSMTHLPRGKFDWGTGDYVFRRHLYVSAGRFFYPGNNQNYVLQSSVLLKSDFTKEQYDANVTATYKDKFWAGLTVRDGSSVSLLFGMKPSKNMRLGYSSDFSLNKLNPYQNGTHEIFIEICIPHRFDTIIQPPRIIWPVRYLNGDKDPRLAK